MKMKKTNQKGEKYLNNLINITNKDGKLTVSSREVAERFEKQHKHVIEAIKEIETSVENSAHLFIASKYLDSYKREQKQYLLTRDGFSLLAMGFTGAKALEWKLKFIEAFNKMEEAIKSQSLPTAQQPSLGSTNVMVKNIMTIYQAAGVDPRFTAITVAKIYEEKTGVTLPPPIQEDPDEMIYDKTTIAKLLGVLSSAKLPHAHAIGAIIEKFDVPDEEKVKVPYNRHGHSGFDYQYKTSVVDRVKNWLIENSYPARIQGRDKSYKVIYSGETAVM